MVVKFAKVRMTLKGAPDWKKVALPCDARAPARARAPFYRLTLALTLALTLTLTLTLTLALALALRSLVSMAASFGVSPAHMDKELSGFISSGRLSCKIDAVANP